MYPTENNNTELDSFDRALLTELRRVAAEGAPAPAARTGRTRKRWAYAGSGVAAAAVTAFGLATLGSPSAYAVDEQGDGDIVITIHELDDADGLEQALADHGIEADVDYRADGEPQILGIDPPPGGAELDKADSYDAGTEGGVAARTEEIGPGIGPDEAIAGEPPAGPCGGFDDMPFDTELTSDDYVITIPADSVLRESDAVLRITTSGDLDDQVAGLDVAYSIGDVDCGFGTMSMSAPTS